MNAASLLAKAAPWLAAAAAGPTGLAGMAIKTAADALGAKAETVNDVAAAVVGATPDQLATLRQADKRFELRMRALGVREVTDLEAIAAGDRKDARGMQVANKSFMPAVLTAGVCASFIGTLGALFIFAVPDTNRDLVVYMVGQLSGAFSTGLAFWFGTTRQSEDKTRLLAQVRR